jgi:hypothetical protein
MLPTGRLPAVVSLLISALTDDIVALGDQVRGAPEVETQRGNRS